MDILIDKELTNIKSHIIDYATIKAILEKYNYKRINENREFKTARDNQKFKKRLICSYLYAK